MAQRVRFTSESYCRFAGLQRTQWEPFMDGDKHIARGEGQKIEVQRHAAKNKLRLAIRAPIEAENIN